MITKSRHQSHALLTAIRLITTALAAAGLVLLGTTMASASPSVPVNTVPPTVAGASAIGSSWTLNVGTWTGDPAPTYNIYWLRCGSPISSPFTVVPAGCTAIPGANSSTYLSTSADAGKYLTAQVAGVNNKGFALAGAIGTAPTVGQLPANSTPPTVSGAAVAGSTWTLNVGTWTGDPVPTYNIYWLRCTSPITVPFTTVPAGCSAITGANSASYVSTSSDGGKYLTAQVAGVNSLGFALRGATTTVLTQVVPLSTPSNVSPPTISGTYFIGNTLTVNVGTWNGNPTPSYVIYWLRCSNPVPAYTTVPAGCYAVEGAHSTTYQLQIADGYFFFTAQVAGMNSQGFGLAGAATTPAIGAP